MLATTSVSGQHRRSRSDTCAVDYLSAAPLTHVVTVHYSHDCTITQWIAGLGTVTVTMALVLMCLYICLQPSAAR